jgi:predicted acyl esterase
MVRSATAVAILGAALAPATAAAAARPEYVRAAFAAHGSVQQIYAVGLRPDARAWVVDRAGRIVAATRADALGGIVYRGLQAGSGYRLRVRDGATVAQSPPLTVWPDRSAPPSTRVYDQRLPAGGYGYLRTRDGTLLAIDVRLPGPAADGPYPTLVEYAGYGYADPAGPDSGIAPIATLLGFAVVDVNMRGTGCSGGSFDYFEPLQALDGYDVIETVARQPWVLGHRVGMLGVSYGGISQLFVAATDPPALAAITPLSVIDSTATTLYPGGILNTGFALSWGEERVHDAEPASATGGQAWAYARIQQGDSICKANQVLHGEAPDLIGQIHANRYYVPSVADPLAPVTFVRRIHVPVYLACQWTDEQTGAHCADLAEDFSGTQRKWFTFDNGDHIDSLDPATFDRWFDFLELYVAHRAPQLTPAQVSFLPAVFDAAIGVSGLTLPADPIQLQPSYGAALAAFQRLPEVRILFDNGAGSSTPGAPVAAFEHSFSRFPIPGTVARSWYLGAGGALLGSPTPAPGADRFTWSPAARPATSFTGGDAGGPGGLWTADPVYDWAQNPPGTAASYVSAPLTADTVVIGAGAVQLWLKASVASVDLQVTVSEVRPDGNETFVQDGWLRASERALNTAQSTLLAPVLSLSRADAAPLPRGRYTEVTVPLYYEGHAYRAGSRIRITVAAPGGDQAVWAFAQTLPRSPATVQIAFSQTMRSRLILPVVPGVSVPTPLPPCPSLRGEPCRPYQQYADDPVSSTG